jgi:RNA polymerase sigma factor (TIGR02999 family)
MNDLTRILNEVQEGRAPAAEELLPAVYDELRRLARLRMAQEAPGHTLQATALVHEAWMRLAGSNPQPWENRRHFFGAAAEAMRRILVDHARRKHSQKRGGATPPDPLDESVLASATAPEEILALNDALEQFSLKDPEAAELVKLRYFVGLTMEEAAAALGFSKRTAENRWSYGRAWLRRALRKGA